MYTMLYIHTLCSTYVHHAHMYIMLTMYNIVNIHYVLHIHIMLCIHTYIMLYTHALHTSCSAYIHHALNTYILLYIHPSCSAYIHTYIMLYIMLNRVFSHPASTQRMMKTMWKCRWFLIQSQGRICIQILNVLPRIHGVLSHSIPQSKKVCMGGGGNWKEKERIECFLGVGWKHAYLDVFL